MPHKAADRIRNVALIGHRGSGKTSLHEALLFEAGVDQPAGQGRGGHDRLGLRGGRAGAGDVDRRRRSPRSSTTDRKINLIDTPGEPSFVADTIGALRVVDAAVVVVNAVMGVEVNTERLWERADEEGLARLVFVNMLDRERADFFRALESLQKARSATTSSRPRSRSAPSTRSRGSST